MRLTISRWLATILACCALVAALLLPIPKTEQPSWFGNNPAALSSSVHAMAMALADRNDAIRDYRVTQGLARWKTQRADGAIQIDRSTPSPIAEVMRTIAEEQWRRGGTGASATQAAVFVYFDSSTIASAGGPNKRSAAEPPRPADVWYALPEMTDGERCVVLVRVRATTPEQLAHLGERSLLGPCAFYAAFGKPGPAVQHWLAATGFRAARLPDWDKPHAPAVDPAAIYALSNDAGRCLTGPVASCLSALGVNAQPDDATYLIDGNSLGDNARTRTIALGSTEPRFLADAVRELGPRRFKQFWTSSAPLEAAFASASGSSLDRWTARWLQASYGTRRQPPMVGRRDLLWLAIALPMLIVIAASKRESVLTERFRLAPAAS